MECYSYISYKRINSLFKNRVRILFYFILFFQYMGGFQSCIHESLQQKRDNLFSFGVSKIYSVFPVLIYIL